MFWEGKICVRYEYKIKGHILVLLGHFEDETPLNSMQIYKFWSVIIMLIYGHLAVWKTYICIFMRFLANKRDRLLTLRRTFSTKTLKSSTTSCFSSLLNSFKIGNFVVHYILLMFTIYRNRFKSPFILKAQGQISRDSFQKVVFMWLIKHANFQLYKAYCDKVIWKNWQLTTNL